MRSYYETFHEKIYTNYHNKSYSYASHFHNKIELAHVFSGCQDILIGDRVYSVKKGETALIFPNTVHEYMKTETEGVTESMSLMAECDFIASLVPDIISKYPSKLVISNDELSEDCILCFEKMKDELSQSELLGWTLILLNSLFKKIELVPAKNNDTFSLAPALVSYINANFQKPLTIKSLALEFGYSTSYVTHIFYDKLKVPFRTYLGAIRSEYAKELLCKGGRSITDIAYECGYTSVNTFGRCFKKHFGITASEYKKSLDIL